MIEVRKALTAEVAEAFAEAAECRVATADFSPAFQRRVGRRAGTSRAASATDESDDSRLGVASATSFNEAVHPSALKGQAKFRRRHAADSIHSARPCSRNILFLFGLALLTACQAASSRQPAPPEPVSAGTLTREYQESTTDTRRTYDGQEITVKGLTAMTAMMPPAGSEEGLILLEEKGANPPRRVACWFSKDQAERFSKIKGGQLITVKGIFNGEAGAELKFCKLVKIE